MKFKLDFEKIRKRIESHQALSNEEINKILNRYRYIELANMDTNEYDATIDECTGSKVYKVDELLIFEDEIISKENENE